MDKPIIEVKNIGKKYSIDHMRGGYVALRDVMANVFKNPFSFFAHKAKRAVGLEKKEEFWALKDVNFSIMPGEVIGVIGANGAGKSTLLKILSQITPPTTGEVILRGRVGSLLEVGTGFHPELTGRENIFLNGAILGMKKREIADKFDEIVAFAGVERFLDTPVKHYSSGMYVRLAFSVAAHMDPDILMVDEVLAVGDAEFQNKCLGKMEEITSKQGRTIIFVSHNMAAIRQLCQKTIVLLNGRVAMIGETGEAIKYYSGMVNTLGTIDLNKETKRRGDGRVKLVGFHIESPKGERVRSLKKGESAVFVLEYECKDPTVIKSVDASFSTSRDDGRLISVVYSSYSNKYFTDIKERGEFRFKVSEIPYSPGTYEVGARILANGIESDWLRTSIGSFEMSSPDKDPSAPKSDPLSVIDLDGKWL